MLKIDALRENTKKETKLRMMGDEGVVLVQGRCLITHLKISTVNLSSFSDFYNGNRMKIPNFTSPKRVQPLRESEKTSIDNRGVYIKSGKPETVKNQ